MDPGLNSLLQWGIENSETARSEGVPPTEPRGMNADALRALMGGPSDADLMKQSIAIVCSPEVSLDVKMTAFDNFEQLIENLDNANNIEPLGLWSPLAELLSNPEADIRRMAAWCVGTAVQNNIKSQERFLAINGIPQLCKLALEDGDKAVRRKAVYALSSEIRNYQPGMNEVVKCLPNDIVGQARVDCEDMTSIDIIMEKLRERDISEIAIEVERV